MSEHAPPTATTDDPVTLQTGLEAFRSSPKFHGPVEDLDGHDCNDHFAQIYERPAEKFEAAIPFVRHGLDQGEQIAYVVDQSTETEVRTALQDAGIDVEAALDSGALTFYTVDETYLRDGSFDPDEMIQFYADATAEATEDFEALRLVAEMSWIEAHDTTVEQLIEYESKINDLFDTEDVFAICQYDRDLFTPEVINNIVRTHPHLVYDGAACHNFYYTPPEELFGDDDLAHENERMLRTLRERTEVKTALQQRDRFLEDLYTITASQDRSFEEKLYALFDLGCEQFDIDFGFLNRVDPADDHLEIEYASGDHEHYTVGGELPLSETYCQAAVDIKAAANITDPAAEGYDDLPVYEEFGVEGYLGTYIPVDGGSDRTLAFVPADDTETVSVSEEDRMYLELIGQWVGYELNRRQRERRLRKCYEITSNPDSSFEEKLEQLLEVGREQFGVEMAGLNHLPSWDGPFRLEKGIGFDVDPDEELWTDPGVGCFCRQTIKQDEPVAMADVSGTDWAEDTIHQQFGLTSYLGTRVMSGATPYGTLWFGSANSRDRPFSEAEQTFIELMGQWVSYELEHREHKQDQQELYRITADRDLSTDEKIAELLELGCERFDLPVGMLTRKREESFEITKMRGSHSDLDEGTLTPPLTDNYCRRVVDTGSTVTATDAGEAGWDGDALYHEFGLECYAGVQLTVGDEAYGTICFTDLSPRDVEFTEAEETFLELMGQCVSYELERNHREAQLKQKTDRLESFASLLAHELRNPTMIGQMYCHELPEDTAPEAVGYISESFDRIEDMIDVLLLLTRGREAVDECAPVDPADVAREAWDTVETLNATLDVDLDRTIRIDETYVRHLFRNLLENAVEHGGSDVTVTVGDLDDGFYVADDGVGIPPEDRDTVFDEGYTTAADNGGTGLGLAFVQKLAEVYDWDVTVTESEAGGARFEFRNVT
ncbi:MEDS domain-containing protein [Halomicrococcus sp. SG-WS-1]|uniref:MEDS domain-containing protein n=1 Tax=Halomicrococcus sp. SG-WS-1 TaxID=3439057 RepID=UPI003F7A6DC6